MMGRTRREFMGNVGKAMLLTGLGHELVQDLGMSRLQAASDNERLHFGSQEPLVSLMQETPPDRLIAKLIDQLKAGVDLKKLVAAGALSNARVFGGQDYIGFHTFMALAPAYRMSLELPADLSPLPVLKVLHRNSVRMNELGGAKSEVLHPVVPTPLPSDQPPGEYLRNVSRTGDVGKTEQAFAALSDRPLGKAFNHLQFALDDEVDVHRIVLAWRGWDTFELAGEEWGHTLLRQSIRYCATTEKRMIDSGSSFSPIRRILPKLLDQYQLLGRTMGSKSGDDFWIDQLAQTIFRGSREQAADAVAQAIVEGFSSEAISEAISIASNRLVLHDPGRPEQWANGEKPKGSCHGDSVGVHASDAANAWRNIARVSDPRNKIASLIVGAFHTGGQSDRSNEQPYPFAEHLSEIKEETAESLLKQTGEAIRNQDQLRAAALVARYGQNGHSERALFDILLRFATSEDGALHAEKYYHTVAAEYATTRTKFRWGQLVALARVTASEFGRPSVGYQEASSRLGMTV